MNFDDFKTARRWNALNRILQVVLGVLLVCALNYLASHTSVHRRWEIAGGASKALSLESAKQLEIVASRIPSSPAPALPWVEIFVTLPERFGEEDGPAAETVKRLLDNLLEDLRYAASRARNDGWLRIERVNQRRNVGLFNEIKARHPAVNDQTALVITCGKRVKIIDFADLYDVARVGGMEAVLRSFQGEDAILGAIFAVTEQRQPRLYYTVRHRELLPSDTGAAGLSGLEMRLRSRNISLRPLELSQSDEVPADAAAVLLAGPRTPFTAEESEKLRRYAQRGGRILLCLDVAANARLDNLLLDWGIVADDAQVFDPRHTSQGVTLTPTVNQEHVLTRKMRAPLAFSKARPVRPAPEGVADETLRVEALLASSADKERAWGERDYMLQPFRYNPERGDLDAPLPVAVVSERASGARLNVRFAGGRVLVVGSSDILTNALLGEYGNEFFLMGALNWLLDREQLVGIPPRSLPSFQLKATSDDLLRVAWRFALFPFAALLLGLIVSLWRRNT